MSNDTEIAGETPGHPRAALLFSPEHTSTRGSAESKTEVRGERGGGFRESVAVEISDFYDKQPETSGVLAMEFGPSSVGVYPAPPAHHEFDLLLPVVASVAVAPPLPEGF